MSENVKRFTKQSTKEYKIEAVKLVKEIGNTKAAIELGVPKSTLSQWVNQAGMGNIDTGAESQTPGSAMTQAMEIQQLRAENKALAKEITRLKKESRADEDGNYLVPVSETYEYKFDYKEVERIFDRFDLFDLHPIKNDIQADDGGSWKITIYTNGQNIKLKGYQPPEPFGDELSAEIVNLLHYKIMRCFYTRRNNT